MLRRLVGLLIALVALLLSAPQPAPANEAATPIALHTYDDDCPAAMAPAVRASRGPPHTSALSTSKDTGDRWSPGASGCWSPAASRRVTTYVYDDPAKLVPVADAAATTSGVTPDNTRTAGLARRSHVAAKSTATMGRAMDSRVIPYANAHGYGYYKGTPKIIPRSLDKVAPNTLRKVDLWFNKRWINGQMRRGNKIVDIGEPPGMPPSSFYDMERRLTSGYWNYVQDLQP